MIPSSSGRTDPEKKPPHDGESDARFARVTRAVALLSLLFHAAPRGVHQHERGEAHICALGNRVPVSRVDISQIARPLRATRSAPFRRTVSSRAAQRQPPLRRGRRGDQPPLVQLVARPLRDRGVHAVLRGEHDRRLGPPVVRAREERRRQPPFAAASDTTVGGSCRWSPANTVLRALNMAPQHAGSSACAASSMTTTSNVSFRIAFVSEPDNVQQTMFAWDTTTETAFF